MKVNAAVVRQLRDQRAWSQEHLSKVSGLSLRTIQRVEADGSASQETLLALAAALGCVPADFEIPPQRDAVTAAAHPGSEIAATRPARNLRPLMVLPLIAAFLCFLDWHQNGFIRWAQWPMLGLGIAWIQVAMKMRLKARSRIAVHAMTYLLVCGILAYVDVRSAGRVTWSQWPMLGWGFGLGMHALSAFLPRGRKSWA